MKFCPYCGERNPDKYKFCASCHEKLPDGSKGPEPGQGQVQAGATGQAGPSTAMPGQDANLPSMLLAAPMKDQGWDRGREKENPVDNDGSVEKDAREPVTHDGRDGREGRNIAGRRDDPRSDGRPESHKDMGADDAKSQKMLHDAKGCNVSLMGKDDFTKTIYSIMGSLNIPRILSKDIRPVLSPLDREIIKTVVANINEAEDMYKSKICDYEVYLKLGNAAFFDGDMATMKKYYKIVQELQPREEAIAFNQAMFAAIEGRWEEAIDGFEQVLRINPKNDDSLKNKSILTRSLGRTEEAVALFDQILSSKPDSDEMLVRKAGALCDVGKYEDALRALDKGLSINGGNVQAPAIRDSINNVIITLQKRDDKISELKDLGSQIGGFSARRGATRSADFTISYDPEHYQIWYNKGVVLGYTEKYEDAIRCFDEALRMNANQEQAWCNKGIMLRGLGRHRESIQCYDKAIALNSNDESTWLRRAVALGEIGKYAEMMRCLNKALAINPKYTLADKIKSVLLDVLQCIQDQEVATAALYKACSRLGTMGDPKLAVEHINSKLVRQPNSEELWAYVGSIILLEMGDVDEAIRSFDKALKVNPGFAHAWFSKGVILARIGRIDDAIECFDEAIKLKPSYDPAWYNKGVLLGSFGAYEDAIKCLDKSRSGGSGAGGSSGSHIDIKAAGPRIINK